VWRLDSFGCSQNPEKTMTVDEDVIEAVTQLGGLVSAKVEQKEKLETGVVL